MNSDQDNPAHLRIRVLCYLGIFFGLFLRILDLSYVPTSVFDETRYIVAARTLVGLTTFDGHKNWAAISPEIAKSPDPNFFHPPLGKLLIGASIRVWGDNAVAWRTPALIFGILSVCLFFLLAAEVFGNELHALFATALFALDFQQILHSRIAMLDMFVCFAFIATMHGYLLFKKSKLTAGMLIMAGGILFGISVKHIAFVLLPAIVLMELFTTEKKSIKSFMLLSLTFASSLLLYLLWCFFYENHNFVEWITLQVDTNSSLLRYFKPHRYGSYPSQWLFDGKPIWYFFLKQNLTVQGLLFWGTPTTWWLLFPALLTCWQQLWSSEKFAEIRSVVVLFIVYILAFFFILRNREGFLYYMLPVSPFLYLIIAKACIIWDRGKDRVTFIILLLSIGCAVWFFPVLTGYPVKPGWMNSIIGFAGN